MNMLCSEGHEMCGHEICVCHLALSPFDSKWYIAENGIDIFAYGYRLTDEELHEYVMELLKEEQN